jgi:hypothetical protein
MITAEQIDFVFDYLDNNESSQEKILGEFAESQPHLSAWLWGESFDILTEEEQDYLYFLSLVVWLAIKKFRHEPEEVDGETIREAEEKNWAIFEEAGNVPLEAKTGLLFQQTAEEDLLAFAEDSLSEDPEDTEKIVTKIGREPMTIALKTVIDVLT